MIPHITAGAAIAASATPRLLLTAIALGTTLAPLNSTMIAVALPEVQRAFGATVAGSALLVTLYLVTMAVGQPIGGRLGDLYGRRRLYLLGIAGFGIASIGCALAPSLPALIAWRTLQAFAGALAIPSGIAIVRQAVPPDRRGAAFGAIGMAAGMSAALGPPLGGLLVHVAGWSAIFWASLPVVIAAGALGFVCLPDAEEEPGERTRFDLVGSVLLAAALGGIVAVPALIRTDQSALAAGGLVLGAVFGGCFVAWERRSTAPIVDVGLFARREFAAACGSIGLSNLVMYTTLLSLPLYLERVRDHDARTTGALLAAMSLVTALFGPIGGRIADRVGRRLPASFGAVAVVAGAVALVPGVGGDRPWLLAVGLSVMGLGFGLQAAPVQTAAVAAAPGRVAGSAAGVYSTARYFGSIAGSTVLALAFTHPAAGDADRFMVLFAGLTVVALVGVLVNRGIGGTALTPLPPLPNRGRGGVADARQEAVIPQKRTPRS